MHTATSTAIISNFLINLLISGSLNLLWGMINCLQIISHFPLVNVLVPANCQLLFGIMVKIATFDVIPVDGIMEDITRWLGVEDDGYLLSKNFHDFDYNTTNPIDNLEVIFFAFIFLMILPVVFKMIELLFSYCNRMTRPLHNFKTKVMYWNLYLRFFLETFLEFSIVSLIRLRFIKATSLVETTLSLYGLLILIMMTAYMVCVLPFLRKNHDLISTEEFKDRFGTLTLGLQTRDESALYYPFVFMLRRFVFSIMVVFLSSTNYFQIQLLVFKTSMVMAFQGQVQPF